MKYRIAMTALAVCYQEVEVEADTIADAKAKALADAEHETGWAFDALYNDGQPHSEVSINTITDEHGEEIDPDD